jgi:hypothetical protein
MGKVDPNSSMAGSEFTKNTSGSFHQDTIIPSRKQRNGLDWEIIASYTQ